MGFPKQEYWSVLPLPSPGSVVGNRQVCVQLKVSGNGGVFYYQKERRVHRMSIGLVSVRTVSDSFDLLSDF